MSITGIQLKKRAIAESPCLRESHLSILSMVAVMKIMILKGVLSVLILIRFQ
ncbi:hypothetical protein D3C81_949330 [compost metagenome]